MAPKPGDVLIRTAPSRGEHSYFVLLDALSERVILGPVPSFNAVLQSARDLSANGNQIWQQFSDDRGRPTGPMMRLDLQLP